MKADAIIQKIRRAGVALESPILVREMRTLLRGRKFFASQMLLLVVLAGILLTAATLSVVGRDESSDPSALGKALFLAFAAGLGVAVIFLVPAFSCTGLTTERETKALDLLLTTTIQPWEVVWGKLLSSLVVIALFMASALPLVTVCFLFGGISPWDLALLYLGVIFCTLVVSSMSLAVSAHCQESKSAVVVSYVLTLLFLGVLFILAFFVLRSLNPRSGAGTFSAVLSGYHWSEQLLIVAASQFLGVSIFAMNFASAANRLKPPTANRSTGLRAIWFLFLFGCLGLYMAALSAGAISSKITTAGNWAAILTTTLVAASVLTWLGSLYFASEEARLSPRLMEDIGKLRGLRLPLRIFMPGPINGLAYALACVVVFLGGVVYFGHSAAGGAGRYADGAKLLAAAVPVGLFILTAAGLAALCSGLGLRHLAAGLIGAGAGLLLVFLPLIHLAVQDNMIPPARSTLWNLHYLSPIIAATSAWEESSDAFRHVSIGGEQLPLWLVSTAAYLLLAGVVWAVALVAIWRLRARWLRDLAATTATGAPEAPPAPAPAPAAKG